MSEIKAGDSGIHKTVLPDSGTRPSGMTDSEVRRSKDITKITVPFKPVQSSEDKTVQRMLLKSPNKTLKFGRGSNNDIQIPDGNISREHLTLSLDDDGYVKISDPKSTNGSTVRIYPEKDNSIFLNALEPEQTLSIKLKIEIDGGKYEIKLAKPIIEVIKEGGVGQGKALKIIFNENTRELSLTSHQATEAEKEIAAVTLLPGGTNPDQLDLHINYLSDIPASFDIKLGKTDGEENQTAKYSQQVSTNTQDFGITLSTILNKKDKSFQFRLGEKMQEGLFTRATAAALTLLRIRPKQ